VTSDAAEPLSAPSPEPAEPAPADARAPRPGADARAPTPGGRIRGRDEPLVIPAPAAVAPGVLLRMALAFYGVVALFAFGYALFSGGLGTLLGSRLPGVPDLVIGIGLGVVLVVLSRVGARAWPAMGRMSETLADLLGPLGPKHAVSLALLSGFAEELLFRGALWPHLGLLGTTLLFGLVHVLPRRRLWIYPLFALLAGLLFGLLREGTQSVWPSVLAHATVNGLNLAWLGGIARRRAAAGGGA